MRCQLRKGRTYWTLQEGKRQHQKSHPRLLSDPVAVPPSFTQALHLTITGPRPSSFSIWLHPTPPSGERLFVRKRGPLATQELKWQRDWRGVAWLADGEAATGVGWEGWESGGEAGEEDEQEAGRRRAEGRRAPRGPAGCTWPRRAGGSAPLKPAASGRERRGRCGARGAGCGARAGGRGGSLFCRRPPGLCPSTTPRTTPRR